MDHVTEDAIVAECIRSNRQKYQEVYDTTLMQGPWKELIGVNGDGPLAQDILDGMVDLQLLETLPSGAAAFLRELCPPPDMEVVQD